MSLGGSKAVFEFSNLILITASFVNHACARSIFSAILHQKLNNQKTIQSITLLPCRWQIYAIFGCLCTEYNYINWNCTNELFKTRINCSSHALLL